MRTEDTQLDDAERRCREYASRFGWLILESIRDHDAGIRLNRLLSKVNALGAQIIVTDTLEMISSDQDTRDDLMMVIERSECIGPPAQGPAARRTPAPDQPQRQQPAVMARGRD